MARIPVVQEPSVRTEGLPTPYARPYATPQGEGAGFGNVLEGAAHVASQFEQEARQKADAANIQGAWGAGQDLLNKQILDPKSGYSALRGKDAMDARDKVLGDYNKGLEEINSGLTPQQQTMFAPHLRTLKEQGFTHSISHESVEMERYSQAQFKGNIDSTMETMQQPAIIASPDDLKSNVGKLYQAGIDEAKRRYGTDASKDAITSVVDPMLQQAALGGMQAALTQAEQSGDPTVASNAFNVLGKYLLKNHQKQIGGMVAALTRKQETSDFAAQAVAAATTSIVVPGGGTVARVDEDKLGVATSKLAADDPFRDDKVKAAEASKERINKVFDGAKAKVIRRIMTAGDPDATGNFRLDAPGVSVIDRMWLRDVNEKDLIGLRDLQEKEARGRTRADNDTSARNYNRLISRMVLDPKARREEWGPLDPDQFTARLLDEEKFPGGFTTKGIKDAQAAFKKVKDEIGKSEEPIATTLREALNQTFKGNAKQADPYVGPLHTALIRFYDSEMKKKNGVAPDSGAMLEFAQKELAQGKITPAGQEPSWYNFAGPRLIDFQTKPENIGKRFTPAGGGAPIERGMDTLVPAVQPAVVPQAATPTVPGAIDKAALEAKARARLAKDPNDKWGNSVLGALGVK